MTLLEYFAQTSMDYRTLAAKVRAAGIEVSDVQMWRVANGRRGASLALGVAIEEATAGAVTAQEIAATTVERERAPALIHTPRKEPSSAA